MGSAVEALDALMNAQLLDGAFRVPGSRDLYMELLDTATGLVWMCANPVQQPEYDTLEFDSTLVKVGIARTTMDRSAFQCSPGAEGKPVQERMIDGYRFINVAEPTKPIESPHPEGAAEVSVNKHHVIGFVAGRTVSMLSLPEGDFVELLGEADGDYARVLPAGARLSQIELREPWVIVLPTPAQTFFWYGESLRCFQGPVTLPASARQV